MDPSNALLDFVQLYIVQGDGFTGSAPEAIHIAILGELTNATPEAVNRVVVDLGALLAVITRPPSQPDGILRACRGCVAAFDLNGSAKRVSPAAHRRVLALQFLLELLSHQECPPLLHYHKKIILAVSTALSASHMLPEAPRVAELVLTILGKLFREGKHDLPSKLDTAIVRQGYDSYFRVIFPAVNNPDCRVMLAFAAASFINVAPALYGMLCACSPSARWELETQAAMLIPLAVSFVHVSDPEEVLTPPSIQDFPKLKNARVYHTPWQFMAATPVPYAAAIGLELCLTLERLGVGISSVQNACRPPPERAEFMTQHQIENYTETIGFSLVTSYSENLSLMATLPRRVITINILIISELGHAEQLAKALRMLSYDEHNAAAHVRTELLERVYTRMTTNTTTTATSSSSTSGVAFVAGSRVQLVNLSTASLNGASGTVGEQDATTGRFRVTLNNPSRIVAIKAVNLRTMRETEATQQSKQSEESRENEKDLKHISSKSRSSGSTSRSSSSSSNRGSSINRAAVHNESRMEDYVPKTNCKHGPSYDTKAVMQVCSHMEEFHTHFREFINNPASPMLPRFCYDHLQSMTSPVLYQILLGSSVDAFLNHDFHQSRFMFLSSVLVKQFIALGSTERFFQLALKSGSAVETSWGTPYLPEMAPTQLRDLDPYLAYTNALTETDTEYGLLKLMRAAVPCHCLDSEDPDYTPPPPATATASSWVPGVGVGMRTSSKPYGRRCAVCDAQSGRSTDGAVKQLKACAQCKIVYYCGKECQQRDWKSGHKSKCGKQPAWWGKAPTSSSDDHLTKRGPEVTFTVVEGFLLELLSRSDEHRVLGDFKGARDKCREAIEALEEAGKEGSEMGQISDHVREKVFACEEALDSSLG